MKNLLAISGSLNADSSNDKIIAFVSEYFKAKVNTEVYQGLKKLPYFEPGLNENHLPTEVEELLSKINAADAILISTPEYVFSLPGVLKNALEWTVASTVLSYKPVGIIVAAASGEKALESLDLILSTLIQDKIPAARKLLISGIRKYMDESGNLSDEDVKKKIVSVTAHLLK